MCMCLASLQCPVLNLQVLVVVSRCLKIFRINNDLGDVFFFSCLSRKQRALMLFSGGSKFYIGKLTNSKTNKTRDIFISSSVIFFFLQFSAFLRYKMTDKQTFSLFLSLSLIHITHPHTYKTTHFF